MQDRFRFRVWKKYNCPSYDGHKPEMFYDAEKTYDFLLNKIPENCFSDILEDEEEYIVMQCTGLKDKNGTLIYEGDIVNLYNKNYKIIYEQRTSYFGLYISKNETYSLNDINTQTSNMEVIGNIYENPELLESEE